jgi:hypothetical protein
VGRLKKYDKLAIYSFRGEDPVIKAALEKATQDGVTLPDVINNFLKTYVIPNTAYAQLQRDVAEQHQVVERERIKLAALEMRLKQKTGDIPEEFIAYYKKNLTRWNEAQRIQFISASAKKLKLDEEWLRSKLEKLAGEEK